MTAQRLRRELGLGGAVVTGLGSIIGTGAFVAIGIASGMWGDAVLWAIPLAALVAVFNGLSSAYLAGRFPVAGGTYEYGYRALNQWLGFSAGWLFILAKTASAATAALGVALYLGVDGVLVSLSAVVLVAAMVLAGIRRTALVNAILVFASSVAIVWFAVTGLLEDTVWAPATSIAATDLAGAVSFLFVAYTGYGRIATLGEEVTDPEKTIPLAVVLTLAVTALLYMAIEVGGRSLGGSSWGSSSDVVTAGGVVVSVGAVAAMLGVLLNLILGLSRVWLAMGRRKDMPARLEILDSRRQPRTAIVVAALLVSAVSLVGDISLAWSFSAMTVLLYYGITNLAALGLDRRRTTAWAGLASCLLLSFFVPLGVWLTGSGLLALGLVWKAVFTRRS